MKRLFSPVLVLLALLSTLSVGLFGQFDSASILGSIKDAQGGGIPNAKVVLKSLDNGIEQNAVSDSDGNYQFGSAKIGRYEVSASAAGFKKALAKPFTATVGARQRVDLTMQVGDVAESVTVSDAAAVLETETSARGTVVGAQQILNLPLNGRAYADLALLAPGVRRSMLTAFAGRDASFNVNGMRSSQNNFVIDGVDNNSYGTSNQGFSNQVVQISPDAVQEFRIETNNFSAEFGRAGGAVINATIRSGGNEFHGSAWEFLRNTNLNAFGFFKNDLNRDGRIDKSDKPVLKQNQFGVAMGGPIKRNKMFVFGDYEGYRRNSSSPVFSTLPQADLQAGNFNSIGAIRNPLSGDLLPNNTVPASQIAPFARDLLSVLPKPNVPGQVTSFFAQPLRQDQNDKGDIRYDHYFNEKVNAFARYSHRLLNNLEPPAIPGLGGGNSNGRVRVLNQQMAFGTNLTLSPTSMLEFRMGVGLTEGGKTTLFNGLENVYTKYNIPNGPSDPRVTGGFYASSVGGYTAFGVQGSNPQFQNPFVVNPKLNYSKVWGKHTMKAGYEFQSIGTEIDDFNPKYGSDGFTGQFSRPATVTAVNNAYNLVDFMYGARSNYQLNNTVIVNYRQRMNFFYFQDDWKVSKNLTLNLGLRYEVATPQWERDALLSNFDPATNSLIAAKKDGSIYDRALVNTDGNNWGPRIGAAYRLNSKTVLRGAYGMSYIHFNRLGGENLLAYNLPNIIGVNINQLPSTASATGLPICTSQAQRPQDCFRTREQGYSNNLLSIANVNQVNVRANYIPKDLKSGELKSYHFSLQRELPLGFVLDVGYVGNRGNNLMVLGDFNQGRVNQPTENLSVNARRPIQTFGFIQIAFDGGFLNYDGLQMKIEKRMGALFFLNSFTYSKSSDNASGHLEALGGDNSRLNFRNIGLETGYTGYDQRYNNTTTFVYELPFGKGRKYMSNANRLVDGLLGGWRLNGIQTLNAGLPVNLTYSPQASFQDGSSSFRSNAVGTSVLPQNLRTGDYRTLLLNPCLSNTDGRFPFCSSLGAGVLEPTDRSLPFGNAMRNSIRGLQFFQFDMGLHKQFTITERVGLQFRFEGFNLFNKTNLAFADSNRTSGTFGRLQNQFPSRELQFALKLTF
jgi:outer membrane receptor protein involved in Fe transport